MAFTHSTYTRNHPLYVRDVLLAELGWRELERLPHDLGEHVLRLALDTRTVATVTCSPELVLERIHTERDGVSHGFELTHSRFDEDITFTPLRHGREHGLCVRRSRGEFLGAYRMVDGSGTELDFDRSGTVNGSIEMRDAVVHGLWRNWRDEDRVSFEAYYRGGRRHGIERIWDYDTGLLSEPFPEFYVHGEQTSRRGYENARQGDPSLPAYRPEDDDPRREPAPLPELDDEPDLDDILQELVPASLAYEERP